MMLKNNTLFLLIIFSFAAVASSAEVRAKEITWTPNDTAYLKISQGNILRTDVLTNNETVLVKKEQLYRKALRLR